jgi:hypothetical protein
LDDLDLLISDALDSKEKLSTESDDDAFIGLLAKENEVPKLTENYI